MLWKKLQFKPLQHPHFLRYLPVKSNSPSGSIGHDTEPIVVRKQVEIKHPVITIQESWSEEHLNSQVVSPTIVGLDGLVNSPLNFPVLLNGSVRFHWRSEDIGDLTKDQDNDQFQIEVQVGTVQVGTELEFVYSSSETFSVHTSVPDDKSSLSHGHGQLVSAISTDLILVTGNIVVPATELIVPIPYMISPRRILLSS